jgi:hypothetical protein
LKQSEERRNYLQEEWRRRNERNQVEIKEGHRRETDKGWGST